MTVRIPIPSQLRRLRPVHAFGHAKGGASAVEFALVLPVLCFLLMGVMQSGLLLGLTHALEQLSANGGRYALGGLDADERRSMAEGWIRTEAAHYGLIDAARLSAATQEKDGVLTVTLFYDAADLPQIAFLGSAIGLPPVIERSATVLLP